MTVTATMYLIVCPLVFLAAAMDAIGGGGGLISLPTYYTVGLSPALASGSNKFSASFGALMATIKFYRSGRVLLIPALFAIAGALPGAYLGAELLKQMDDHIFRIIMVAAIPLVAVFTLSNRTVSGPTRPVNRRMYAVCLAIGLGCGFYDGFFGPGTGTFLILLFTRVAGMDMLTATGTAKPVNLASNVAALASLIRSGDVIYSLAIPAAVCAIAGGFLGAKLALWKGANLVRNAMLVVLAIMLVKIVYEFL